jgi:endogenous inhibitor of DNA gyrase (YacG/DUF329 family)
MKASCPHCHSSFEQRTKLSKFCSMKCAVNSRLKVKLNSRECLYCGKNFKAISDSKKYCSQACKRKVFMDGLGNKKGDKR